MWFMGAGTPVDGPQTGAGRGSSAASSAAGKAGPGQTQRPHAAIVTRLRSAGCVFAEDEARLLISAAQTPDHLAAMVDRRAAGLPLEHVLGWAEFCGLRIAVEPGVFIPRRRTEFLVQQATAIARKATASARQPTAAQCAAGADQSAAHAGQSAAGEHQSAARADKSATLAHQSAGPADHTAGHPHRAGSRPRVIVVDLCCGSGAVGAALAAALNGAELYAVDIDPAAVRCARRNVGAAGGQVYEGDLYQPLPATLVGHVNVLVANAPYVPTDELGLLPPEARLHEPRVALDGGEDGLAILRQVIAEAPLWLAAGGCLLVETSERQAPEILQSVARAGLISHLATSAELNASVVMGTRPARQTGPGR